MLKAVSQFAAGRRTKWVVLLFWLVLVATLGSLQPKLQKATVNSPEAYLPKHADSTKALLTLKKDFPEGRDIPAVIVYHNPAGLSKQDTAKIVSDAQQYSAPNKMIKASPPILPYTQQLKPVPAAVKRGQISPNGTTATVIVPMSPPNSDQLKTNVDEIRSVSQKNAPLGLTAHVTGAAGTTVDAVEIFESLDGTVLMATVLLVLVLLLLVYRSPVITFVPLIVVGSAYSIAAGLIYLLVKAGTLQTNGQTTAVLIVLMFGAGTDYALLIVSRFKEELRQVEDKHEAMARATARTTPAILSAGGTVVLAMLVLTFAQLKSTSTMGPVLAIGVAIMVLAGLTLLPALLAILGRKAFWPATPKLGTQTVKPSGIWRRVGKMVHDRPVVALVVTALILAAGALGNFTHMKNFAFGEGFRKTTDSALGTKVLVSGQLGGRTGTTDVVANKTLAATLTKKLSVDHDVKAVALQSKSADGKLVRLNVLLRFDALNSQALKALPRLREIVRQNSGARVALVGGPTAQVLDTEHTTKSDSHKLIPAILLVVFLILVLLLRALVAPLYLIATVLLSFAFTFGVSLFAFKRFVGYDAIGPDLLTFSFIFLVALGVDYNIFLMSRVREESAKVGIKEGVIRALETTGGVITSAGLILAGTFLVLTSLPLKQLLEVGAVVAFGVLIDTFIVRTVLVPSIAFLLGKWNWWPSKEDRVTT